MPVKLPLEREFNLSATYGGNHLGVATSCNGLGACPLVGTDQAAFGTCVDGVATFCDFGLDGTPYLKVWVRKFAVAFAS